MTDLSNFWRGRRVLITGHTGFKGGWLAIWLRKLGADLTGIALQPTTKPNLFDLAHIDAEIKSHLIDIRDYAKLSKIVHAIQPEIIFHLAAQPLVRSSYNDPLHTYSTNVMGTANLLESMRGIDSIKVAVMVTTDKVYHNREWHYPYRETDSLGGYDPYSSSKAASEFVIESYRRSFLQSLGINVASARAGNVIGGGDWSQDRLIPDAIRAWQAKLQLQIRQPRSIRPWQHVLEPLHGYMTLAQKLWKNSDAAGSYNFGPLTNESASVQQVIELARSDFSPSEVFYLEDNQGPHEACYLALETAKVRETLGIHPVWSLAENVRRTMVWYQAQSNGVEARELCLRDIANYETACRNSPT